MNSIKTILMGSAAAISLAAAPTLAQDASTNADAQQQTAAEGSYDTTYGGDQFAGLGDRNVDELVGTELVNEAGESIGEIDNFGLSGNEIVAIVGVGGFLGMGEHSVALPMDRLTYDGDKLVISGVTKEELEAMPEYNEGDSQAFASDQTFRSGYDSTAGMQSAQMTPSDNPAADQPMDNVDEEVAEADAEDDAEMTPGDEMAEAEQAVENTGEQMADAAEETGDAIENAGEEAASEVAQAGDEVADETEQMAESAEAEVSEEADEMTADATEADMADDNTMAETETADASTSGTMSNDNAMASDSDNAMASEGGWTTDMDSIFADIADQQIAELIGMEVASADGEVVGEVDNFALNGQDVVAIVGVGGFLGIGEHDVALSLGDMTYDGEKLVLSSLTEEQLREMPEYDEAEANYLPEDGTLRSSYE